MYSLCNEYIVPCLLKEPPLEEHNFSKDKKRNMAYAIAKEVMEAENRAGLGLICPSLLLPGEWREAAAWQEHRDQDVPLQLRLQQRNRMRVYVKLKRKNQN